MQLIFSAHNPTSVGVRLQWLVLKDEQKTELKEAADW